MLSVPETPNSGEEDYGDDVGAVQEGGGDPKETTHS